MNFAVLTIWLIHGVTRWCGLVLSGTRTEIILEKARTPLWQGPRLLLQFWTSGFP